MTRTSSIVQLETQRLILRHWLPSDYPVFAQMNASPQVMRYMPKVLGETESNALADRCADFISLNGWGLWAVELKNDGQFIGFVGLAIPSAALPCSPCTEIGWRLTEQHWGMGYASEAAKRALEFAFADLRLDKIVSFTTLHNEASRNVMRKLGLKNARQNFPHPSLVANSPLREHVLYTITREEWLKTQQQGKLSCRICW